MCFNKITTTSKSHKLISLEIKGLYGFVFISPNTVTDLVKLHVVNFKMTVFYLR